MRLDAAQLADLTAGEVAFGWNGRKCRHLMRAME
jgi:hypothetical protein